MAHAPRRAQAGSLDVSVRLTKTVIARFRHWDRKKYCPSDKIVHQAATTALVRLTETSRYTIIIIYFQIPN